MKAPTKVTVIRAWQLAFCQALDGAAQLRQAMHVILGIASALQATCVHRKASSGKAANCNMATHQHCT